MVDARDHLPVSAKLPSGMAETLRGAAATAEALRSDNLRFLASVSGFQAQIRAMNDLIALPSFLKSQALQEAIADLARSPLQDPQFLNELAKIVEPPSPSTLFERGWEPPARNPNTITVPSGPPAPPPPANGVVLPTPNGITVPTSAVLVEAEPLVAIPPSSTTTNRRGPRPKVSDEQLREAIQGAYLSCGPEKSWGIRSRLHQKAMGWLQEHGYRTLDHSQFYERVKLLAQRDPEFRQLLKISGNSGRSSKNLR